MTTTHSDLQKLREAQQLASEATRAGHPSRCICSFRDGRWNFLRRAKGNDGCWHLIKLGSTTVPDRVLDKMRTYAACASRR